MTRKKVKLAYIANDSSRKATYKKRKKGLMKKVNELSTLCGITACAIIYSPYDSAPEVWPSTAGVQRVVSEFRALPEMDQSKKKMNQESFLKQRIAKVTEHLKKQRKDNREIEMTEVMSQCLAGNMGMFQLNIMDLNDLGYLIEQYLKDCNRRIEILQKSNLEIGESSSAPPSEAAAAMNVPDQVGSSSSQAFFNHLQPRYPAGFDQNLNLSLNQNQNQNQNQNPNQNQNQNQNQQMWFTEMMNNPEQMNFAAEQMGFPFMEENNRNHHQVTDDNAAAITNNIWFR